MTSHSALGGDLKAKGIGDKGVIDKVSIDKMHPSLYSKGDIVDQISTHPLRDQVDQCLY